jgi:hypothetical protein
MNRTGLAMILFLATVLMATTTLAFQFGKLETWGYGTPKTETYDNPNLVIDVPVTLTSIPAGISGYMGCEVSGDLRDRKTGEPVKKGLWNNLLTYEVHNFAPIAIDARGSFSGSVSVPFDLPPWYMARMGSDPNALVHYTGYRCALYFGDGKGFTTANDNALGGKEPWSLAKEGTPFLTSVKGGVK